MSGGFRVIVLGCTGGPRENNLSGYLLYPAHSPDELISLDAGTLLSGIDVAASKGNLDDFKFNCPSLTPVGEVFTKKIKAYLISHAHLDHIAALVINSQLDEKKIIVGIDSTIDDLKTHIFNWVIWPNFADEGNEPKLNQYHYFRLPKHQMVPLERTGFSIEAHILSHPRDYPSSAFIIKHKEEYVLYFGDTSPDALEPDKHFNNIWLRMAPLVNAKKLRGIFLECSVPYEGTGKAVYGHLDSRTFMQEFHKLQEQVGVDLKGLKVVVAHRKESFCPKVDPRDRIADQLREANDLELDLIFPTQGDKLIL